MSRSYHDLNRGKPRSGEVCSKSHLSILQYYQWKAVGRELKIDWKIYLFKFNVPARFSTQSFNAELSRGAVNSNFYSFGEVL